MRADVGDVDFGGTLRGIGLCFGQMNVMGVIPIVLADAKEVFDSSLIFSLL